MSAAWLVYVLVSERARRTYVGVTNDLPRRLEQHNGARPGGAKATRAGRPWRVGARYGPYDTRGEAQRVERAVKTRRGPARLRAEAGLLSVPGRPARPGSAPPPAPRRRS